MTRFVPMKTGIKRSGVKIKRNARSVIHKRESTGKSLEPKQKGNGSKPSPTTVQDYNELEALEKIEGREVLVLYTKFIYRVIRGEWQVVGQFNAEE